MNRLVPLILCALWVGIDEFCDGCAEFDQLCARTLLYWVTPNPIEQSLLFRDSKNPV